LPLREWFHSKENEFYERIIKREDLYLRRRARVKRKQNDQKRWIELSNQILPLINFEIKEELFKRKSYFKKTPFLGEATI